MNEIIFLVENAVEGGYTARALGESIFTEGDNLEELRSNIRDAVDCHLGQSPTATNIKSLRIAVTFSQQRRRNH